MRMKPKMYKVLAIGNSFSEDAFYYLHEMAKSDGRNLMAVNLYIGGCSLKQHVENLCAGNAKYMYQKNGVLTDRYVSIQEILREEEWDIIMTQQASHDSGVFETYFPYLEEIVSYIKKECPHAKLYLHETWAYEMDSTHEAFPIYHNSQTEMYEKLEDCYQKAARMTGLTLIPSGRVIQKVRKLAPFRYEQGEKSLCRDGFHMDMIYGRYLVSGVLYTTFFKADIRENSFLPDGAQQEYVNVIKNCIYDIA